MGCSMKSKIYAPFVFAIFFAVSGLCSIIPSSPTEAPMPDCGECPNPLVELKPMIIGGEIPDHFKEYATEFAINYWQAWAGLFLKEKNRCADQYYYFDHEGNITRIGVQSGDAKYIIEPWTYIEEGNGMAVVNHASGWNGNSYTSIVPDVVSRLGSLQISYDLIALKNKEKYDVGIGIMDWVPEPPEGEFYGYTDESVWRDGVQYLPNDGIFQGDWSPATLASSEITLDKGDIGIAIRKKETPSEFSITVDDTSAFPPIYKITLNNIKNLFNEAIPNNVKIAINVDHGSIHGGDELDGWNVFTTLDGQIPSTILYEPPECPQAEYATLEIAPVCDWHDGQLSIGQTRVTNKLQLHSCSAWEGTVSYKRSVHRTDTATEEYEAGDGTIFYYDYVYQRDVEEQATVQLDWGYDHTSSYGDTYFKGSASGSYYINWSIIDSQTSSLDGFTNKSIKEVQCAGTMGTLNYDGMGGGGGMLIVDSPGKDYELHIDLASPTCAGTETICYEQAGQTICPYTEPFEYSLSATGAIFEGEISQNSFSGSWEADVCDGVVLPELHGPYSCGVSWSWSFKNPGD